MIIEPKRGWSVQRRYPLVRYQYHWECTKNWLICVAIAGVIFVLCQLCGCDEARASEIPEARAVNALIGEAESLGYTGMLHIACSLRNRGHLRGVYGEKAPRVVNHKYSPKTLQDARRAWADSAKADVTKGSDHWASKTLDQEWEKKMIKAGYTKTYEDKGHVFYKGK